MAMVAIRSFVFVEIRRQPHRGKCAICGRRRELYRVHVEAPDNYGDETEARCAECWGMK